MARDPVARDWELLGLAPGASPEELRAAYARRRGLYDPEALATYSLHDVTDREALLDRLDDAYRAIGAPSPAAPAPPVEATGEPAPAPDQHPGAFLRHQRVARQVTTDRLATETKIRASMLELLESEAFAALPAPVYVRGFVVQCARVLKLDDPEGLAEQYLVKMRAAIGDDS
jgi:hypothetical protein